MNSYEKYMEDKEHKEFFDTKCKEDKTRIYYLQRKLKSAKIEYNSRKKEVYPTPEQAENKYVVALLKEFNYNIQTRIE